MADFKDIDADFEFNLDYRMDDYLLEVKDDYFGTLLFGTDEGEYRNQKAFKFTTDDGTVTASVDLDEYNGKDDFDETELFFEDGKLVALEGSILFEEDDEEDALECFYELMEAVSDKTDVYPEVDVDGEDEDAEDADEEDYPELLREDKVALTASWLTPDLFLDLSIFNDDGKIVVVMYIGINPDRNSNFFAIDDGNFELLADYVSPDLSYYDSKDAVMESLGTDELPFISEKAPFGFENAVVEYDDALRLFFVRGVGSEEEGKRLLEEKRNEIAKFYEDEGKLVEEDGFFNSYYYWKGFSTETMLSLEKYKDGYALFIDISEMDEFIPCMMAEDDKPVFSDDTIAWAYDTLGVEIGSDMDIVEEAYASLMDDYSEDAEQLEDIDDEERNKLEKRRYEIEEAFSILSEYFSQDDDGEFDEEDILDALDTLGLKEGAGVQDVYDAYSSFMDEYVKKADPSDEEKRKNEEVSAAFDKLISYFDEDDGDELPEYDEEDILDAYDTLGIEPEKEDEIDYDELMENYLYALNEAEDENDIEEIENAYDILADHLQLERAPSPLEGMQDALDRFGLDAENLDPIVLGEAYLDALDKAEGDEEKDAINEDFELLKNVMRIAERSAGRKWSNSYFDFADDSDEELMREALAEIGLEEDADEDEVKKRFRALEDYLKRDEKLSAEAREELIDALDYIDLCYEIRDDKERRDDLKDSFALFGLKKSATAKDLDEAFDKEFTAKKSYPELQRLASEYYSLSGFFNAYPILPTAVIEALKFFGLDEEDPADLDEDTIVNAYYDKVSEEDDKGKDKAYDFLALLGAWYDFDPEGEMDDDALKALEELGLDTDADDCDVEDAIDELYANARLDDDIEKMKKAEEYKELLSPYFSFDSELGDGISEEDYDNALLFFDYNDDEDAEFEDILGSYCKRLGKALKEHEDKETRKLIENFQILMNVMND